MSRFNRKDVFEDTGSIENHAGGLAYEQSDEVQLISVLLNSFFSDRYYYSNKDELKRLQSLILKLDPVFVAQTALYARREFGLRTITHIVAGELAYIISGKSWAKTFYKDIIKRPDDMLEILSYISNEPAKGKTPKLRIPNAMRKGFKAYIQTLDAYSLTKYQRKNATISLKDVILLVRPKRTPLLNDFLQGRLKAETWESKLTQVGQVADTEEQKILLKQKVWRDMLLENKLPHMALLRNLRNIIEQADGATLGLAVEHLRNEYTVRNSMVLPFRYYTAYKTLQTITTDAYKVSKVLGALSQAMQFSVNNIPAMDGDNLVVIDHSGSMNANISERSIMTYQSIGDLMGGALVKKTEADVMVFGDNSGYVSINSQSLMVDIIFHISTQHYGHGTNFHAIFEGMRKKYDRIFIFSDMEGWGEYTSPQESYKKYCKNYMADPYVYLFDLEGGGTSQIHGKKIIQISGFSEKVFDMISVYEQDKDILINKIKEYVVPDKRKQLRTY